MISQSSSSSPPLLISMKTIVGPPPPILSSLPDLYPSPHSLQCLLNNFLKGMWVMFKSNSPYDCPQEWSIHSLSQKGTQVGELKQGHREKVWRIWLFVFTCVRKNSTWASTVLLCLDNSYRETGTLHIQLPILFYTVHISVHQHDFIYTLFMYMFLKSVHCQQVLYRNLQGECS